MTKSMPADHIADPARAQLARVGNSWSWSVTFGVLTLLAGLLVLAWLGTSILALAVVLGIWLLVVGIYRLVAAIAVDDARGGGRALTALLGVLAILVGILCLARPFQTATALALLLGAFWVVSGVLEFFHGIVGDTSGRRWALAGGLLSVIAGIVVLGYPGASLVVLAWLFGIWLIVLGATAIAAGLAARPGTTAAHRGAPTTRTTGPVTP